MMAVTLKLANQIRRLARENLTVAQIAHRLGRSEQAIVDAFSKLGMPLPGEAIEERIGPSTSNR